MKKLLLYICIFSSISLPVAIVDAQVQNSSDQVFSASIDTAGLSRDLSFSVFGGELQVGLPAGRMASPAVITLTKLSEAAIAPSGLSASGGMYQIDIPQEAFRNGEYYVSLKSSNSAAYKRVYFFDKNKNAWQPIDTTENISKGLLSINVGMPFVRLAVFENSKVIVRGDASWYRYKNGLFAASPDFPKGARLRVINLDNKKSVEITVNDHGPDRSKHPTRVLDLDAVAFARLAPLGQGTMRIAIEEVFSAPVAEAEIKSDSSVPTVSSRNAVILNSADTKVLWGKNENTPMPLASLTKLVAIKTFLETKPNLAKVVAYSIKDEQQNAKYVLPSESARLRLKDKDQVTVRDLVYSSLIGSTNNTVETLVRVSGLSRPAFIAKMNTNVKKWGARKTTFVEPTGLSPKNVTTAAEYAIIARQVFLDDFIAAGTVRDSYTVKTINTKVVHSFKNTNTLAREKDSTLLGSKTGYLVESKYCLATKWPTSKDKNIIIVVLGAPTRQASINDTKELLEFAEQHIK